MTFHLREGLTYSDGSPLTAERFRYAVERACDPNTAGDYQYVLFDVVGCQFAPSTRPGGAPPRPRTTPRPTRPRGRRWASRRPTTGRSRSA